MKSFHVWSVNDAHFSIETISSGIKIKVEMRVSCEKLFKYMKDINKTLPTYMSVCSAPMRQYRGDIMTSWDS